VKTRYNVRLADGAFIALKPSVLIAADGGAGAGGGGGGGMPGMGGQATMLQALLAQLLGGGAAGLLPAGVPPEAFGGVALVVMFALPKLLGVGLMQSALVCVLLGGAGLSVAGGKGARGALANGRQMLARFCAQASQVTGRPISATQVSVFLLACVGLLWRMLSASPPAAAGDARIAAYTKGFNDGQAGSAFDPISDSAGGSSSSRFGIGSLFNIAIAGSMLKQWLGSPPSLQNLMDNGRRANPMQLMMLVQIISSLF